MRSGRSWTRTSGTERQQRPRWGSPRSCRTCTHPALGRRAADQTGRARDGVGPEAGRGAGAVGMTGSPTLLFDGNDPFAREGLEPSLACGLYPQHDGHIERAPSADALRHTIDQYDTARATHTIDTGDADQCCDPSDRAAALRVQGPDHPNVLSTRYAIAVRTAASMTRIGRPRCQRAAYRQRPRPERTPSSDGVGPVPARAQRVRRGSDRPGT